MKKRYLAGVVSLCLSQAVMASVITDARSAGSAGVGVASGDYTRSNLNPALLTRFQSDDDVYFKIGVGAHEKEFQHTTDKLDNFQNKLEDVEQNNNYDPSLLSSLNELEHSPINANLGVDLAFYVPSKTFAFGVSLSSEVLANGNFHITSADKNIIQGGNSFDPNTLTSTGLVRGAAITEAKLSMANDVSFPFIGEIAVGLTPKFQRIDTYIYERQIYNFDTDGMTDQKPTTDNGFNFDIGIQKNIGIVQFGLVGKNLISRQVNATSSYEGKILNETWHIKPTVTAGVAVQHWGMTLAADVDLIKDKSFVLANSNDVLMLPRQWAKVGAEIDIFEQVQLRAGYKKDLTHHYEDEFTAGIGISPFDLLTIDIAAQYVNDDDLGAALQLGFKF